MKISKKIKIVSAVVLACLLSVGLLACGGSGSNSSDKGFRIAVPSDTTNEARALLLLESEGLITLKEGAGLAATANDIVDNPYHIEIVEAEAAALPRTLDDVDAAVINGNYVLSSGLDPTSALASEDAGSEAALEYANVIAVRPEDANSDKTKALLGALQSDEIKAFIDDNYLGQVVALDKTDNPEKDTLGVSGSVQSDDKIIRVGASPSPHAEILAAAKDILERQGYTLEIVEFSDYIQPNLALSEGELDANYFQHLPYLEDYNAENGTDILWVAKIHFEPLALYPGKISSLSEITS